MPHPAECCGGASPQPTPQDASHPSESTTLVDSVLLQICVLCYF